MATEKLQSNLQDEYNSTFDKLSKIWFDADTRNSDAWKNDIWRKANTMSAVLGYWGVVKDTDSERAKEAIEILTDGWTFYQNNKNRGWWVDDFGWLSRFMLDVYAIVTFGPNPLPFSGQEMKNEALFCHDQMIKNIDAADGGIWNVKGDSASRRNTVTNTFFWELCTRLAQINAGSNYATQADQWYKWLFTGEWNGKIPQDWRLFNNLGIVSETPLGAGPEDATWYWSGDQGNMWSALINYSYLVTDPKVKQQLIDTGIQLAKKTILVSGPFVDKMNIMHESPSGQNYDSRFANDYATGKGVFLRHLASFAVFQASLKTSVVPFLAATVQAAWNTSNNYQIARDWNPGQGPPQENVPVSDGIWPQVLQTCGMDAFNAALKVGLTAGRPVKSGASA